jgi:hypothetical protein
MSWFVMLCAKARCYYIVRDEFSHCPLRPANPSAQGEMGLNVDGRALVV